MPARAERLYLFPAENDQPGQVMEMPVWWPRRGLFEKFCERMIDLGNPVYVDHAFLLTPWEALAWDKQCREEFSANLQGQRRNLESEMRRFETALQNSRWVIVESYEWESGLA